MDPSQAPPGMSGPLFGQMQGTEIDEMLFNDILFDPTFMLEPQSQVQTRSRSGFPSSRATSQESPEQQGLEEDEDEESETLPEMKGMNRKERNREHARRSRLRKKFLLESLQKSNKSLRDENERLKQIIRDNLGASADTLLSSGNSATNLFAQESEQANKILDKHDFGLIKALQTSQRNFVITDPTLPDNPIVFASGGFLNLTGYHVSEVVGRNCRFLQGPKSDMQTIQKMRDSIAGGYDLAVCILNYKKDGSTFWNHIFLAPLCDSLGNVVNFVGVQCPVSEEVARAITAKQLQA